MNASCSQCIPAFTKLVHTSSADSQNRGNHHAGALSQSAALKEARRCVESVDAR